MAGRVQKLEYRRLFEKYAIASMIRKNPTENITIAANASQPDGSSS